MQRTTGLGTHNKNQPKRDLLAMTEADKGVLIEQIKEFLEQRVIDRSTWKNSHLLSVALETMPKQVNEDSARALRAKVLEQKAIEELESKNEETRQNISFLESKVNDLEQRLRQIT